MTKLIRHKCIHRLAQPPVVRAIGARLGFDPLLAVVQMELRVGAITRRAGQELDQLVRTYAAAGRVVAPSPHQFDEAGAVLRTFRSRGREIRRASLVNDLLIALTARRIGATVYTYDTADFEAIRRIRDFSLRAASGFRQS